MDCVVDWGNTRGKVGFFQNNLLLEVKYVENSQSLWKLLEQSKVQKIIISDVSKCLKNIPSEYSQTVIFLNNQSPIPIKVDYATPETLGMDRVAAAVGATIIKPNENCLVIDMGSCITYDIVTKNIFKGGSITLGMSLRFRALNEYTGGLPLINIEKEQKPIELPSKTTEDALKSGVIGGIIAEIQYFIKEYQKQYKDLSVLICGGDAFFFETKIKEQIFVVSNLTLLGLQGILQHYAKLNIQKK